MQQFSTFYEQRQPVEIKVIGDIPAYAAGVLYRTGPGGHEIQETPKGRFKISHWFDGFGQTHRFELRSDEEGKMRVFYNSRFQVDNLIEQIRRTGDFHNYTFGQRRDPCMSIFGKIMAVFRPADAQGPTSTNINVTINANSPGFGSVQEGDLKDGSGGPIKTVHLKTDFMLIKEIDPQTLEPIGIASQESLHPELKGHLSAAHAKSDPKTGDIFNFNLDSRGRFPTYRIFKVSASTGKTEILARISGPGIYGAYLHSLFLSEDFVILCVWNSHLVLGGTAIVWTMNVLDAICDFDPKIPAKWFVVDRRNGKGVVGEFESPAFFAFHTVNAWQKPCKEDAEYEIICNVIQYPNLDILHKFYYENLMSTGPGAKGPTDSKGPTCIPKFASYSLKGRKSQDVDLSRRERTIPSAELLAEIQNFGDLPVFHQELRLKSLRYIYTVVDRGYSTLIDGLCKVDLETKESLYWDNPHGHTPSEAIFVARPSGVSEDDGVLLTVVLDGFAGKSYLLCLDAQSMKEIGRAEMDCVVSFGFHGQHVSNSGKAVEF